MLYTGCCCRKLLENRGGKMKKWTKTRKIDWLIVAGIVLFSAALAFCGHYTTKSVFAEEKCGVWDIQPPVLCKNDGKSMFYGISPHEFLQVCDNGTSVLWILGEDKPIPISSYSVENTWIHYFCFVEGRHKACKDFTNIINDIVECQERNSREEN